MFASLRHWLGARKRRKEVSEKLFGAVVTQSRRREFYMEYGVPDTLDGRYDMLVVHVALLMIRLQQEPDGKKLCQSLFDRFFRDMERSLREIGVGDLSVPRHMKRMMRGFNGRAERYRMAFRDSSPEMLEEAVRKNIYGDDAATDSEAAQKMVRYIVRTFSYLQSQDGGALSSGNARFLHP